MRISQFLNKAISRFGWKLEPIVAKANAEKQHLPDAALGRVRELVTHWDAQDCSGDYKRHQVYSQLVKEYPMVKKSTISLAIEAMKCGL